MNVFETKAFNAISSIGVDVIGVQIGRSYNNFDDSYMLLYEFNCPCWNVVTELIGLPENWASNFERLCDSLRNIVRQHLKNEGLLQ